MLNTSKTLISIACADLNICTQEIEIESCHTMSTTAMYTHVQMPWGIQLDRNFRKFVFVWKLAFRSLELIRITEQRDGQREHELEIRVRPHTHAITLFHSNQWGSVQRGPVSTHLFLSLCSQTWPTKRSGQFPCLVHLFPVKTCNSFLIRAASNIWRFSTLDYRPGSR